LCRMHGIPARVAGGLVAHRDPTSGLYQFSDASFHAWPEILTEEGWVICEISAAREQIEQNAKPGCPLPHAEDLAAAVRRAREENRRAGGDPAEEGSEQAGAGSGEARGGNEPTRLADQTWPGSRNRERVRKPEQMGEISGDREKQRRAREEEQRREMERKRAQNRSRWRQLLIGFALICLGVAAWKYNLLERFATAVLRGATRLWQLLFGARPRKEADQRRQALEGAEAFSERLGRVDASTLAGTDVVRLFNQFVEVMGFLFELSRPPVIETSHLGVATAGATHPFSWAARQETETVAEYFARLGVRLRIDDESRAFLARTFSISLYGGKRIPDKDAQRFRHELRRLLQEARERFESQAI
jgi:hypothetical protein